jgi:uncharacterized membrane protein
MAYFATAPVGAVDHVNLAEAKIGVSVDDSPIRLAYTVTNIKSSARVFGAHRREDTKMMNGFGLTMMGTDMILMLAFWVLVIAGGVWLALTLAQCARPTTVSGTLVEGHEPKQVPQNPTEILKVRYAKGEITRQQFEGLKSDLAA